jgi:hypothetical protein
MNVSKHALVNRRLLALVPASFALASIFACSTTVNAPAVVGCAQDDSVQGCTNGAFGYSCGNGESPDQSNSSLDCSDGLVDSSSGLTDYCCIDFTSTTCSPDSSVDSCQGESFGFSCTGTDSPDEADSSLTCSNGVVTGSLTLYCCVQ